MDQCASARDRHVRVAFRRFIVGHAQWSCPHHTLTLHQTSGSVQAGHFRPHERSANRHNAPYKIGFKRSIRVSVYKIRGYSRKQRLYPRILCDLDSIRSGLHRLGLGHGLF